MSWGPRARSNYRLRKMATRAILREARRRGNATPRLSRPPSAPRPAPRSATPSGPLFVPRPRPDGDRDQAYAHGARNVFFGTLAAFVLAAVVPGFAVLAPFLSLMLVVEAGIWVIYQAQYFAARRKANEGEVAGDALDEFGVSGLDRDSVAWHPAQAAERAREAEEQAAAARKAEAVYRQMLHDQTLDGKRQEALRRQAEASRQFQAQAAVKRAQAKEQQAVLDQELRWMRDAKHGKFGQGAIGEHDLTQPLTPEEVAKRDEARRIVLEADVNKRRQANSPPPAPMEDGYAAATIEAKLQILERRIREGPPVDRRPA